MSIFQNFNFKQSAKQDDLKAEFKSIFMSIAPHKHRYSVFSDFIFCMAAAYRNSLKFSEAIEAEYLKTINSYKRDDIEKICKLFSITVLIANEGTPADHLGYFYAEMNFTSTHKGQFFTPDDLSYLMIQLQLPNIENHIKTNGYATISDPACGAGSTFLACIRYCMSNGVNPQKSLFIHGQDIDRVVALMCYVQLCIWHIPCEICIGDTLKNEKREIWHSPAYHLGRWENRLRFDREKPAEDSSVNFILIGDTYT